MIAPVPGKQCGRIHMNTSHLSTENCNKTKTMGIFYGICYCTWCMSCGSRLLHLTEESSNSGAHFKNTYELLNLRALKFSPVNKFHIFQCMGKIFCVELQRIHLKFHTQYLTHTVKMWILYNIELFRALRIRSSCAFCERTPWTLAHPLYSL